MSHAQHKTIFLLNHRHMDTRKMVAIRFRFESTSNALVLAKLVAKPKVVVA